MAKIIVIFTPYEFGISKIKNICEKRKINFIDFTKKENEIGKIHSSNKLTDEKKFFFNYTNDVILHAKKLIHKLNRTSSTNVITTTCPHFPITETTNQFFLQTPKSYLNKISIYSLSQSQSDKVLDVGARKYIQPIWKKDFIIWLNHKKLVLPVKKLLKIKIKAPGYKFITIDDLTKFVINNI
jgi:hypothetical protein